MIEVDEIAAVILAGGKASRMNYQDKALLNLHKKPLIEHVIAKIQPQVGEILVSVNHNPQLYEYLELPLIPDLRNEYAGPLVGIYSAMHWLLDRKERNQIKYLACFAADAPSFPDNLVTRLASALPENNCQFAYCVCNGQIQPLFSFWSLHAFKSIEQALDKGMFGPKLLISQLDTIEVEIPLDEPGYFFNINSTESLDQAEKLIPEN